MESQTTEYKQQWPDKYLTYNSGFTNAQQSYCQSVLFGWIH